MINKSKALDLLKGISKGLLLRRCTLLKNYVLSKSYFERANNKNLKFNSFRKWKNYTLKFGIEFKVKTNVLQQNNTIKTLLFFKKIEKTVKQKILKILKRKILRYKQKEQPKKIDYYVNQNQVR